MAVEINLRPTTIAMVWENFKTVETMLEPLWPIKDNPIAGPWVKYDLIDRSRERPRVNTRTGRPNYQDPDPLAIILLEAQTWRDGARIDGETLHDMRKPGSSDTNRFDYEVQDRVGQLRRRLIRFQEWERCQGMQGIKSFYPPGMDSTTHYDEQLVTATTCIDSTVAAAWNTASATQAAARTNLASIRTDFETAHTAMGAVEMVLTDVWMNSVTLGYIETQWIAAGYEFATELLMGTRHLSRLWGVNVNVNDLTYVHPVSGATTYYIPTGDAIFIDSDNARTGRQLIQCNAVHVEAPAMHMGVYFSTYTDKEPPGEIRIGAEWSGIPSIPVPCSQYVYTDVTNA